MQLYYNIRNTITPVPKVTYAMMRPAISLGTAKFILKIIQMSVNRKITIYNYIQTIKYYVSIKKNELQLYILTCAERFKNLLSN